MTLIGKFQKGNDYAYLWSKGNYNYELASTVKSIVVLSGHTQEESLEYLAENGWELCFQS